MTDGASTEGLGHRYPGAGSDQWSLRDASLAVDPGEVLAVVGPSGSGKTTLLRLLSGLLTPTAGRIRIGGADVTRTPPERRPVAMVFQGYALFPHLSVRDNIAFGPRVRREPKAASAARVAAAAETLGLTELMDRRPAQLSGGERQRVALARALVRDPTLFCLDEPLSSLDPVLRTEARRSLARTLRDDGRCAVYVTHDQVEALTVGDRVAVLRAGRVEQVGTPRELYQEPASVFIAGFVGSPPMSLLGARAAAAAGLRILPSVRVGVRPEGVHLVPGAEARVEEVEDLGHELHVVLSLAGEQLVARVDPMMRPVVGGRTGVEVDQRMVRIFGPDGRAER